MLEKKKMSTDVKNNLFPVFLKLQNLHLLIVGGGKIGLEKITAVLNNSPATKITLVATYVSEEIKELQAHYSNITILQRSFIETDLNGVDIVIVAVNNKETSLEIKRLANQKHILANVADTPDQCDFYLGSIVQKGNVKIAISTNGKSPTLAKRIRETFEESFPLEINESLDNLTKVRSYLSGDFTEKVIQLNSITSVLASKPEKLKEPASDKKRILMISFSIPIIFALGYLLCYYFPPSILRSYFCQLKEPHIDDFFLKILTSYKVQMPCSSIRIADGVKASTAILFFSITPTSSFIGINIFKLFTKRVSSFMNLKVSNVSIELLKSLFIPSSFVAMLGLILAGLIASSIVLYSSNKILINSMMILVGMVLVIKSLNRLFF